MVEERKREKEFNLICKMEKILLHGFRLVPRWGEVWVEKWGGDKVEVGARRCFLYQGGKSRGVQLLSKKRPDFSSSARHTVQGRLTDMGGGAGANESTGTAAAGALQWRRRYLIHDIWGISSATLVSLQKALDPTKGNSSRENVNLWECALEAGRRQFLRHPLISVFISGTPGLF